ncbi:ATP-binding protein [Nodosilinea sp. E11]|uniref:ATP-binding protein n=1 Tax=Nodosilinea sp. E11 TaxID=3037479 RepID=UPI00293499D3|nr:ATP-binding protein [Nodosilinea sp. E11]WOD37082.1 ATP-binding protein [Nodosilinea sp. E11]
MSLSSSATDWYEANHRYLIAAIAQLHQRLSHQADPTTPTPDPPPKQEQDLAVDFSDRPPALDQLCQQFGLSAFEREVLLLSAGMELDPQWKTLCAAAQHDSQRSYPTWGLALAISPQAHWTALQPDAPLRRWRLVDIGPGNALVDSPLRLDEQVMHYLMGHCPLSERLLGLGAERAAGGPLVESHCTLAEAMAQAWVAASQSQRSLPVLQLWGRDEVSMRAIAATTSDLLGLELWAMTAETLPTDPTQLQALLDLWEREWQLNRRVLLLNCDRAEGHSPDRDWAIAHLSDTLTAPPLLVSATRRRPSRRPQITHEVPLPNPQEQRQVWTHALGDSVAALNGHLDSLVSHFNLSRSAIETICCTAQGQTAQGADLFPSLWQACSTQARPQLDALAQRIAPAATWDDLVLPDKEMGILKEVAAHVRQRAKVYEQWGFAGKGQRGLGISALFAGASGTGKTLAAEILGNALKLDVYRIDLSAVVSKYIGETEKNLRLVFDAAEGSGVVLLFDEADALFGKRTEVKDSHDRHANLEVSYLLQRMEAYRGLAILTTNLKASLDQAFLRRIRFVVQFPFPDAAQRAEIWRQVFPAQTPLATLDYGKLGRLNVPGGNIRNIALNAAFLAADADQEIAMPHLLQAARSEYLKLERPLTDTEVKGWV